MANDILTFRIANGIRDVFAITLKSRNNIEGSALAMPGPDRPTIKHQCRTIYASHGHDDPRHIFITTRYGNETVVPLSAHDRLDGIRNEIAGLKRKAHA